ncbi:MAG: response regulator [Lewinellaceae bacterium]|nr:response regulator [Lewinellaceae bacterium]
MQKWKTILLLPALWGLGVLQAQGLRQDSLRRIWEDAGKAPVERLSAAQELARSFDKAQADSAIHYEALGLELARAVGNDTFQARLLYDLGIDYGFAGNMKTAQATLKEYLSLAMAIKRTHQLPLAVFHISYTYALTDDVDALEGYLDTIIPPLEALITDTLQLVSLYQDAGQGFSVSGKYPQCIYWDLKALNLLEQVSGSGKEKMSIYNSLGYSYCMMESTAKAEEYTRRSMQLARRFQDTSLIISNFDLLSQNEVFRGNYEQALAYIDSAIALGRQVKAERPGLQGYRGRILIFLGRAEEAIPILQETLEYYESNAILNDWRAYICAQLGLAYLQLQQYERAIAYGRKGLEFAQGLQKESMENYEVLYKAWEALGNMAAAYDAYNSYITYRDSIVSERNAQLAVRLELENEFQRVRFRDSLQMARQNLERELAFQQQLSRERANRNIFIAVGAVVFLLAIGLGSRLRFIRQTQLALAEKTRQIEAEKEKAQASERAKQQFLANMSHEIRTPMNAIKGMTDILLRRAPKVEQLSYLKAIKDSSGSLLVIINDILDLSKIEADKVSLEHIPFSLEEVVHNVATVMQFKAEEKGLELKTNIDQSVPAQVLGDPTRLHQVLLNLLGNAVKFTEKGLVSIRLSVEPDDGANQIVTKFCVSDTGVGMDESRLDKIFESFEQAYSDTSRKFGGTGLGLSISKKLVELQRGRIWAESEKGKGSRFYVSIPYEMAGEEERAPATALDSGKINPAEALKGIKVLLAEDNAFNAIVAQEELEDAIGEVEVVVAENGAIAVEQATHDDFDVILMDVQMPVMNGYEATQKIRLLDNGKANIPIIAMTANVMKEEVERCYEAGMNDFIGKPFETEVLMGKLAKYCRGAMEE